MPNDDKTRLIAELKATHEALRATVNTVDLEMVVYPDTGWKAQDLLSHLTAWYLERVTALRAWQQGGEYSIPNYDDTTYNQQAYEARKNHSAQEHVHNWEAAHTTLLTILESLQPEDFAATIRYPWGASGSLSRLIKRLVEHQQEHHQEILERKKAVG